MPSLNDEGTFWLSLATFLFKEIIAIYRKRLHLPNVLTPGVHLKIIHT